MLCCLVCPMAMIGLGSQGILWALPRYGCGRRTWQWSLVLKSLPSQASKLQNLLTQQQLLEQHTAMCVRTLFRLVPRLGTAGAGGTQSPSRYNGSGLSPFSCMSAGTTGGLLWGVFRSAPHSVGSVQRSLLILLYTYLPTSNRSLHLKVAPVQRVLLFVSHPMVS